MFAAVMLGQISGAWASRRLVPRLGIARLLRLGRGRRCSPAAPAAAALAWAGVAHWLAVVLPFFVFLFGTALDRAERDRGGAFALSRRPRARLPR